MNVASQPTVTMTPGGRRHWPLPLAREMALITAALLSVVMVKRYRITSATGLVSLAAVLVLAIGLISCGGATTSNNPGTGTTATGTTGTTGSGTTGTTGSGGTGTTGTTGGTGTTQPQGVRVVLEVAVEAVVRVAEAQADRAEQAALAVVAPAAEPAAVEAAAPPSPLSSRYRLNPAARS